MKNTIIKIIVCIVTFSLSVLIISALMNRGSSDITMDMSPASYPIVYMVYHGEQINALHGYSQDMDVSYMRDTITPLNDNRELSIYIDSYNTGIKSVGYEVRSTDGTRLIETGEIHDYQLQGNGVAADFKIKDLIDKDTEYELVLLVGDTQGRNIKYYTRVIQRTEDHAYDELVFVKGFHNKTFDKEGGKDIAQYLETNETGDNTTYSYVNIHSSYKQITWGDLNVSVISDPQLSFTEYFSQTARLKMSYFVNVNTESSPRKCRVDEYYRLSFGTQRIYLLDYERTMTEVFEMVPSAFSNNKLDLGIRAANVEILESEDGGTFAFESAGRLFCYNSNNNRFSKLFAFFEDGHEDERTYYDLNDIKVLNIDEAGNVHFAVYGYMNRGVHEGKMGVAIYRFNGVLNTIEEEAFIPYNRSFATLKSDMERLMYLNSNNELFVYLGGSIFSVNLDMKNYSSIINNLSTGNFKVSDSNRMIAWSDGEDEDRSKSISVMNLNTKTVSTISAGTGNYIKPLGFMEEDLIYGLIHEEDLVTDYAGGLITPMYCVNICKEPNNEVTMRYEKSGIYVMDVVLNDNQITMMRATKSGNGSFVATNADQIMSSTSDASRQNVIEVALTESFEKIVQIAAKNAISTRSLKFMTPKEVMYEGGHEIEVSYTEQAKEKYYVYGADGIIDAYTDPSKAVILAEKESGTVINRDGSYVWVKANRSVANQIMKIKAAEATPENSSLAVCLDTMLLAEGITRNSQYLLSEGSTALSVLEENMPEDCKILDLSGCSLNSVLYYVNRDIPVMAILKDRSAVLIVGYNELNTVLMDPSTGTIYKKGINDSTDWFNQNGNQFITYVK